MVFAIAIKCLWNLFWNSEIRIPNSQGLYNNFSQQNRIVYHHMFLIILMSCMWRRWPVETTLIIVIVLILSFSVIFFFYSPRNYKYNVHSSRRYQPERNLYSALRMWHMKPTLQLKVIYLRIDMDFLHFFSDFYIVESKSW